MHVLGTPPAFILSQDQTLRILLHLFFRCFISDLLKKLPRFLSSSYHSSVVKVPLHPDVKSARRTKPTRTTAPVILDPPPLRRPGGSSASSSHDTLFKMSPPTVYHHRPSLSSSAKASSQALPPPECSVRPWFSFRQKTGFLGNDLLSRPVTRRPLLPVLFLPLRFHQ